MRIISGKYKGRRIDSPEGKEVRPTSARTREAVFNIISHGEFSGAASPLSGKPMLDLFCGTGAFGLEALSRGASYITFIDIGDTALSVARRNVHKFGENSNACFLRADATKLPAATRRHSLVFLDPPYQKGLVEPTLNSITEQGWLDENAVIVVEQSKKESFIPPAALQLINERRYGNSRITLLRHTKF